MSDKAMAAAGKELEQAAATYSRVSARAAAGEGPANVFTGLEGQDVFLAGHRFHTVGTLREYRVLDCGEAVAIFDGVWQIGHDTDDKLADTFFLGDGIRLLESSIGWIVQPVASRPEPWRKSWESIKGSKTINGGKKGK